VNLADAIRKAAQSGGTPAFAQAVASSEPAFTVAQPEPQPEPELQPEPATPTFEAISENPHEEPMTNQQPEPEANHPHPAGNVVRLELFLSPEQFHNLFKAVFTTQHSVLTLREAANYLRIPAASLEAMAADGQVPAMQVDGRWRFTKTALDEWISTQQLRKESA
jgi:excisionase family DNA binding protein